MVLDGLADHSIKNIDDPSLFASMLGNVIFGLALRAIPREPHYIEEHHCSGRCIIRESLRVILSAVRA